MKAVLLPAILFAASAIMSGQATQQAHHSDLGFSYSVPSDWQIVSENPTLPVLKQDRTQSASDAEEKRGIQCIQLELNARHGAPPSVITVLQLPFACFGQTLTDADLPGLAQGASEGLKQNFVLSTPVYGSYTLGSHSMWIERASGVVIGHPEMKYTLEIACSVLKLGAACWMTMAADDLALHTFERGKVSLDGEPALSLVPASAFDRKPGT